MIYEAIAVKGDMSSDGHYRVRKKRHPVVRDKVGSLLGQVTFHSHLHYGQGAREAACQQNH